MRAGDLEARLLLGDALQVLPTLPAASVDAVVTDPPWKDYETGMYDASGWHSPVEYLAPETYAAGLHRVLRDASACLLWCGWECFERHAAALRAVGFTVKNCVVWAKANHTAGDLDGNLGYRHEVAVFAVKGHWRRHGGREVNLWQEPHLFSRAKRHHPTQKPVGLMARSVRLTCPPGGLVLDPFAGSASTGVACVETGRRFLGVEKDPRYHAIGTRRLLHARAARLLAPRREF